MVDSDISFFSLSKTKQLIDSNYFGEENKPYSGKIVVGPKIS